MKISRLLVLGTLFLVLSNAPAHGQAPGERLNKFISGLKNRQIDNANQFIDAIHCGRRDSVNLGFGCWYIKCEIDGVTIDRNSVFVAVLSLDGKLMEYAINVSQGTYDFRITNDTALNNTLLTKSNVMHRKSFLFKDETLFKKYKSKILAKLGGTDTKVADTIKPAYQILYDPIYQYPFGMNCYNSGDEPLGRKAIHYLERNANVDVLKSLIAGCNPEGRIYAIELFLQKVAEGQIMITGNEKALIKNVLNLDIQIDTCQNCKGMHKKGTEVLTPALMALLD